MYTYKFTIHLKIIIYFKFIVYNNILIHLSLYIYLKLYIGTEIKVITSPILPLLFCYKYIRLYYYDQTRYFSYFTKIYISVMHL